MSIPGHAPFDIVERNDMIAAVPTIDPSRTSRPAAQLAIVAAIAALLSLASLHVLSPEYDPSWRMVSEYANGHYGWVLSVMFLTWGASTLALVVALRLEARTTSIKIGLVVLTLAGIGEAM